MRFEKYISYRTFEIYKKNFQAHGEFPLLTVALKHFHNTEPMVRTAIRTVTLSIFGIQDDSVQRFVNQQAKNFFPDLMRSIMDKVVRMDTFIRSAQNEPSNQDRLSSMIDEQIGYLHYFGDIFALNCKDLVSKLKFALQFNLKLF